MTTMTNPEPDPQWEINEIVRDIPTGLRGEVVSRERGEDGQWRYTVHLIAGLESQQVVRSAGDLEKL